MNNEYLTQTQLGRLYGVSSHKIGKWLTGLCLRENGHPTKTAIKDGLVKQAPSTKPGTYFSVWNKLKTTDILDKMGYERAVHDPEHWESGPDDY